MKMPVQNVEIKHNEQVFSYIKIDNNSNIIVIGVKYVYK
jgi:hypothetical protein